MTNPIIDDEICVGLLGVSAMARQLSELWAENATKTQQGAPSPHVQRAILDQAHRTAAELRGVSALMGVEILE
jgi:hypothetical protein